MQNEYIKVITNNKNMGKGYSLIKAFKKAQGEIICFIDSDLQIPALTLRGYYKIMRGSRYPDILIGSKRHYNSKIDYPLLRRVYSFGFQTMNRLMFGLKLLDTQTGVKFFKKDVLKDILPELRINGFAIDLEILSLAQMKGYKILEAPVHINESFSSTINIKAVLKMLIDSIKIWWRFKFNILKGGKKWKKIK